LVDVVSAPECQERAAKVRAHNERVSSELARAERGEIICLSDLMASQEELITEEIRERQERVTDADRQAHAERAQDAAIERVLARESAPELVNGCNLEACLTYAQERVSALEERVERWRSHAQDLEREVNANLEELRGLRAELQR
jgi:hypothetical protein